MQAVLIQVLRNLMLALEESLAAGEVLPPEVESEIANLITNLVQRIQSFQEEDIPTITPTEDLNEAMPSSNVEGFAYDDKNQRLLVRFLGKYPNRNGPIYAYGGVPANIFEIFRKGLIPAKTNGKNKWGEWWKGKYPSIGAALYHVIRNGGYPYQKLA